MVYRWRETDAKFAAAWDEAAEKGVDGLEDVARIRAEGVELDVVDKDGKVVGRKIEHSSDRILELMSAKSRLSSMIRIRLTELDAGEEIGRSIGICLGSCYVAALFSVLPDCGRV
jgi:hypothetical protein